MNVLLHVNAKPSHHANAFSTTFAFVYSACQFDISFANVIILVTARFWIREAETMFSQRKKGITCTYVAFIDD